MRTMFERSHLKEPEDGRIVCRLKADQIQVIFPEAGGVIASKEWYTGSGIIFLKIEMYIENHVKIIDEQ